MTDQLVTDAVPTQRTRETNIQAHSWIRIRDPSHEVTADQCFRPHSHQDRLVHVWYIAPNKHDMHFGALSVLSLIPM
jgi:hypothetical protein